MTPEQRRRAAIVAWRFAVADALERLTINGPGELALAELDGRRQVVVGMARAILRRLDERLAADAAAAERADLDG